MKTIDKRKKHKPNLNGPYSVEPKKELLDEQASEGTKERKKIEDDKKKKDPAVVDRQE